MENATLLRRVGVLSGLDDPTLEKLGARCEPRAHRAGVTLFSADDRCQGLYVIRSGRVRVYRCSPDGREQVTMVAGPGQALAELSLFDQANCISSAVTMEETHLIFLSREAFLDVYGANPEMSQAVITALVERLRSFAGRKEPVNSRDVAGRLAVFLADYADQAGHSTPGGIEVSLHRTQEELSREIGTARESVSRAFKALRQRGLLEQIGHDRIVIRDVAELRAAARN
jgi:CRP/FNR family transcriptional regulator, dissimilatory nitrate respiration regulator